MRAEEIEIRVEEQQRVQEPKFARAEFEIAVLIPCFNEAMTVSKVVRDFRSALPQARIYVYDNNSKDGTGEIAARSGATVRREALQGKGNVVRRMFADVEADIYVLVDGDDTYDAGAAPAMIKCLLDDQMDLVNARRAAENPGAYRWGHRAGNVALTGAVARIFGNRFADMLSGYKVLSRRFVKSFPIITSTGFEIETELAVHALELNMPTAEIVTAYRERPEGSTSKLRTYRDALRILRAIFLLLKEERPLAFFSGAFALLVLIALVLAAPVIVTFIETGLVPRLPTAVLATGLVLLGFLSLTCGLILDTVTRGRKEMKRLQYLTLPAAGAKAR
jgi:glycosyltransferase involved in cell wall biosynthesis